MSVRETKSIVFDQRLCSARYTCSQIYVWMYDLVVLEVPLGVLRIDSRGEVTLKWATRDSALHLDSGTITLIWNPGGTNEERASLRLFEGTFPPSTSGSLQFVGSVRRVTSTYRLEVSMDLKPVHHHLAERFANAFSALSTAHGSNNVRFFFPRCDRSLWSNEAVLSSVSPYLSTLLQSGFSDSTSQGSPTAEGAGSSDILAPLELDDSDEEPDKAPIQQLSEPEGNTQSKFKTVRITQATYTTYRNVLCWIGTECISFARLKSHKLYPSSSRPAETIQADSCPQKLYLPLPASPKSIYRLPHLLEISELCKLALANFKSQLTTQNVAYELYSDDSDIYPEIRDITLEYAVDHWTEAVKSKAFADVKAPDDTEGKTGVLLSKKLVKRWEE